MLPPRHRMTSSREFSVAVKGGRRAGRKSVVVHYLAATATDSRAVVTDPARVGLIVSKSVGNAVVRHSVSRRLRAAARDVVGGLDDGSLVVIRALRAAAGDGTPELTSQLRSGLKKSGAL